MNELQEKLLGMMEWFHNFCEKEELKYYVLGGTALGAIRHKGFIPWDDDIDIGMPRKDYERLRERVKEGIDNKTYEILFPGDASDHIYPFAKVYDTSTTLIENVRIKPIRGIFLDVFPLDGVGNTEKECKKNYKKINRELNILNLLHMPFREGRVWYKTLLLKVFVTLFSYERTIGKIEVYCKANTYAECHYVGNLMGAWRAKEIMKKEWFGKPQLVPFESINVYIPENCHEYLTKQYGDYMKLPPVEKQVSHHDWLYFNLHESYLTKRGR